MVGLPGGAARQPEPPRPGGARVQAPGGHARLLHAHRVKGVTAVAPCYSTWLMKSAHSLPPSQSIRALPAFGVPTRSTTQPTPTTHADTGRFSLRGHQPQVLPEPGDLRVNVTMPSAKTLADLDTLELDFSLSCPGHFDAGVCYSWP